jgi:hypothetical protein
MIHIGDFYSALGREIAVNRYITCALLAVILSFGPMLLAQNYPAQNNNPNDQNANQPYNQSPEVSSRASEANATDTKTLPEGTQISIRTNEAIDSKTAEVNQTFAGEVSEDVLGPNGQVEIPRRSPATLILRKVNAGGTTGTPELALDLKSIEVNGHRYHVRSSDVEQSAKNQGIGKNKRTGEYVGGGAVLGTLLGAVAGGGKGAAIGAVAGAAAGGGAQVLTKGKDVKVPAETVLKFQLEQPLHLVAGSGE